MDGWMDGIQHTRTALLRRELAADRDTCISLFAQIAQAEEREREKATSGFNDIDLLFFFFFPRCRYK